MPSFLPRYISPTASTWWLPQTSFSESTTPPWKLIWSRWNSPPDLATQHWLAAVSFLRRKAAWFGEAFFRTELPWNFYLTFISRSVWNSQWTKPSYPLPILSVCWHERAGSTCTNRTLRIGGTANWLSYGRISPWKFRPDHYPAILTV